MERLTFDGTFCDIAQCRELPCPYNNACTQRQVWERLKQYEDSGLSPIACEEAKKIEGGLSEHVYSIARMVELMQADKDGRVVVLPCQSGERVFALFDDQKHVRECEVKHAILDGWRKVFFISPVGSHGDAYSASFGAFGKTVFLTREEAEKALEAMKDGN